MELTRAIRFATLLHSYRASAGLTQEELAERAGLSARAISDLERGVRRMPQRETLALLAQALALSAEQRTFFDAVGRGRPLPASAGENSTLPRPVTVPSGTITVLCTDVADNTGPWEQHPHAMQAALARHDVLLQASIAMYSGVVVAEGGEGDRVVALFARPRDALAAACTVQQALATEPWPEAVGPLQVRMALHSGDAGVWDGRAYRGATVSRAARLRAAAHGGQILLSAATYELVRDDLPDEVTLRDLGKYRLTDLTRPEHIIQVLLPGLPADFPPLQSLDAQRHTLPVQPTPLIGREREIAAVRAHLLEPATRLLTLTGPGGTGKTRLALQVAAEALAAFPDGVYFVDLVPITQGDLMLPTIAQVLQVTETGGVSLRAALHAYLAEKRLLLVLDNCEQLVEAAPVVADLLAATTAVRVLATSRATLRLRSEHVYAVPPLALPEVTPLPPLDRLAQYEAVRLFVERARAVQPAFALNVENALAVASICIRLDGLPLAIELAAARARLFTSQALLVRLADRLGTLTQGARDLPERQRTLRATIDWSYHLLAPDEQMLFARMAVFVGGCALEAVEAICNLDGKVDVLEALDVLVTQSLLRQEAVASQPRFMMLETIREYALEQLQVSDAKEVLCRRHAEYYLAQAEEADVTRTGTQQQTWLRCLDEEYDNARAALQWAIAHRNVDIALRLANVLGMYWETRGRWAEGSAWLEQALAIASNCVSAASAPYAKATALAAWFAGTLGNDDRAMALAEDALALSRMCADRSVMSFSLYVIATVTQERARAMTFLEESATLAREAGDKEMVARALQALGMKAQYGGDYECAVQLTEEALELWQELGNSLDAVIALAHLGMLGRDQGHYPRAITHLTKSLHLSEQFGYTANYNVALGTLAFVTREHGDYEQAHNLYDQLLALWRQTNVTGEIARALLGLADVARDQGDHERVTALCKESLELCRMSNDELGIGFSLHNLGMAALLAGRLEQAMVLCEESLAVFQRVGMQEGITEVLASLGLLMHVQGDPERAKTYFRKSLTLCEAKGPMAIICAGLDGLAGVAAIQGYVERAARVWGAADALRSTIGVPRRAVERRAYEQAERGARIKVNNSVFTEAWAQGQCLPLEQAIDEALGVNTLAETRRREP